MSDNESLTSKQVRLVLETQCRELAVLLKAKVPAGVGFVLWLAEFGAKGNMAYASSIDREDVYKLVHEWLDLEDANHPDEGWHTAVLFLQALADAIGFKGLPEPEAVLSECRRLADVARKAGAL